MNAKRVVVALTLLVGPIHTYAQEPDSSTRDSADG